MPHALKKSIDQFRASTAHLTKRFFAKAKDTTGDLYIYDVIGAGFFGGVSAKDVVDSLAELKDAKTLNIYLNSPGGDVFEGITIYNALRRHSAEKRVYVDGLAASIASIIALAGDHICTSYNAMWMIHDPWTFAVGSASDLRKAADNIDKAAASMIDTYAKKTKGDPEQIKAWMAEETWMSASEAKERGFTDEVLEPEEEEKVETPEEEKKEEGASAQASPLLARYKNTPEKIREQVNAGTLLADVRNRVTQRASPLGKSGK